MTTLVFVSGPLDANRRVVKLLRKHADVVDCGTLALPREAAVWITKRLEKDELTIEPKALRSFSRPPASAWGESAPRSRSWCCMRRESRESAPSTFVTW